MKECRAIYPRLAPIRLSKTSWYYEEKHNYERIAAYGNKHTYGCRYCGATRTIKVGAGSFKYDEETGGKP